MASNKSKKSSRGRTTEAKLLITAASVAATLSGLAMFATQNAETLAQNQSGVVASIPAAMDTEDYSPVPFDTPQTQEQEQAPPVEATATPVPATGGSRSARGLRSQQGQQSLPNAMGTTRSSR